MSDTEPKVPPTAEVPPPEPERASLIDAVADLLQTASDWVRQEAGAVVREKVVLPLQKVGIVLASALAAGCLAAFGLVLVAVALFMFLGEAIGYPLAVLLVGLVYLAGAAAFLVVKARSMQR